MLNNLKVVLISAAIITLLVASFYAYYRYSENEKALLIANNAKLQLSIDLQKQTIAYMEEQAKVLAEANINLSIGLANAERENALANADIDNTDFNVGNEEEIEKRINEEYNKSNRSLEQSSNR